MFIYQEDIYQETRGSQAHIQKPTYNESTYRIKAVLSWNSETECLELLPQLLWQYLEEADTGQYQQASKTWDDKFDPGMFHISLLPQNPEVPADKQERSLG